MTQCPPAGTWMRRRHGCVLTAAVASPATLAAAGPVLAMPCNASAKAQQWDFMPPTMGRLVGGMLVLRGDRTRCLDINATCSTADESVLREYTCHPDDTDPSHQNQLWVYNASTQEIVAAGCAAGQRVDVSHSGTDGPGSQLWTFHDTGAESQKWSYDLPTGLLKSKQTGYAGDLCMHAVVPPPPPRPCTGPPGKGLPWCDTALAIDARVADMVSRMDLKTEKIPNLDSGGAAVPSLGLELYNFWSEASSGRESCF